MPIFLRQTSLNYHTKAGYDMNLWELRYFTCIADQHSISRAAAQLFLSQSALSQALKKLESEIGCPLFIRNGHGLSLTKAGEIYYKSAVSILEINDQALVEIHKLSEKTNHTLSIGVTGAQCMKYASWIAQQLRCRYPEYQIKFVQDEIRNLCASVKSNRIACAIGATNFQTGFSFIPLANFPFMLYVSDQCTCLDRISEKRELSIHNFADQPFALISSDVLQRRILDIFFEAESFQPTIYIESKDYDTIYNAVNHSAVLTLATSSHCDRMPNAHCVMLKNAPVCNIGILYADDHLSPYLKDFFDLAVKCKEFLGN